MVNINNGMVLFCAERKLYLFLVSQLGQGFLKITIMGIYIMNVGGFDKIARIVIGVAVIAWGAYAQNWWGAVGFIPLLTGLVGWCPAYLPFGLNTYKVK